MARNECPVEFIVASNEFNGIASGESIEVMMHIGLLVVLRVVSCLWQFDVGIEWSRGSKGMFKKI